MYLYGRPWHGTEFLLEEAMSIKEMETFNEIMMPVLGVHDCEPVKGEEIKEEGCQTVHKIL